MAAGRRRSLADLVNAGPAPAEPVELPAPPARREEAPAAAAPIPAESPAPAPPPAKEPPAHRTGRPRTPKVPKYRTLERKETLLRADQVEELTKLRRRLNRARGRGVGERITENTIIRVAVDLLLTHGNELQGVDEEELRNSVTSRLS